MGWVIQFNLVGNLFKAAQCTHSLTIETISNESADLKISTVVFFEKYTPLWSSDKLIVPRSSSETGFDAVGFWEGEREKIFRFIQVTCNYRHDLILDAFYLFA